MPSASATEAMVLAVNMPAQAPSVGQALRSMASSSASSMVPAAWAPTASKTLVMSSVRPLWWPGGDGAAVDDHARHVEAGGGHEHPGQRLVAAGEGDHGVEPLGVHDGLDRVGDDLAGHQRGPHALVAHRDAVADGDGVELDRV